ncbi:MarR family winged helix-turn-helix transcriptional regulator [Microbacterium suaedae]|uniref:MarR family winged helix-turn-helix transcriptional regulator n=1 Tax=Microbacterium suaedae TaxID=2067813 RepID=UPI0013A66D17|nr:MarR family winged helix-turn-helix transcriptional regulator [Microbacterium suaedae]
MAKSSGGETSFIDVVRRRINDESPELDAEATGVLFNLARASNIAIADLDSTVWRSFGVSYAGYRVLFVVWAAGPLEPRTIARLSSVSRASISSVINTLERDGYVERRRESEDRRLVTVDLTDKGRQLWHDSFALHNAREREWLSSLTGDEREQLTTLLEKLIQGRPRDHEQ